MGRTVDTWKLIEKTTGAINPQYDAQFNNFTDILNNSKGMVDMIYNGFVLGYAQGMKAAKAERRRKRIA